MGLGGHAPVFGPGYTITCLPSLFKESTQIKLSLFVDFMTFYFTKTHACTVVYFNLDKEASSSRVLRPPQNPYQGSAPGLCWGTPCYVPQPWRQIDGYDVYD